MSDDQDNVRDFVSERFRRTDEKLDRLIEAAGTITARLASLENQVVALRQDFVRLEHRVDGFDGRLSRIERRLDLSDAPAD
jgi:hypothetical protein